jgi:hypothetical protein
MTLSETLQRRMLELLMSDELDGIRKEAAVPNQSTIPAFT